MVSRNSKALSRPTPVHDAMVAWTHQGVEDLLPQLLDLPKPGQYWWHRDRKPADVEPRIHAAIGAAEQSIHYWQTEVEAGEVPPWARESPEDAQVRAVERQKTYHEEQLRKSRERHTVLVNTLDRNRHIVTEAPPPIDFEITEVKWELPIDNGRSTIVGYVDLYVSAIWRRWYLEPGPTYTSHGNHATPKDYELRWVPYYIESEVYFEVKPEIPSVGELLRQINKYRHYRKKGVWVVVCPDDRFAKVLASQDVKLVVPAAGQQQTLALGE